MPLEFKAPKKGQITTGFLSKHASGEFNEKNSGLGYISPEGLLLGAYINSLNKPSVYMGKEWKTDPLRLGPVDIQGGLLGGAVTGYSKPLLPFLMPEVIGSMGDHSLSLGLLPPIKGVTPATAALQYRRKF